jgi:hypothetical protein
MAYTRENWPQRLRAKATVEDKPKEQELMQDPKGGGVPVPLSHSCKVPVVCHFLEY